MKLAGELLARLEELGKLSAVATQNIDGLHHAAGSQNVFELHGTYRTGHCPKCKAKFDMAYFFSGIESGLESADLSQLRRSHQAGCRSF